MAAAIVPVMAGAIAASHLLLRDDEEQSRKRRELARARAKARKP